MNIDNYEVYQLANTRIYNVFLSPSVLLVIQINYKVQGALTVKDIAQ